MTRTIAEQIPNLWEGIGQPRPYATYVLRCDEPSKKDFVEFLVGFIPSWYDDAAAAPERFYVGSTSNIQERIRQHESGEGALFTTVCSPIALTRLHWAENRQQALRLEEAAPRGLRFEFMDDEYGVPFVYQQ